jgi:uncharacterized Fe-S cluster-containing radical SAM superfamily protein
MGQEECVEEWRTKGTRRAKKKERDADWKGKTKTGEKTTCGFEATIGYQRRRRSVPLVIEDIFSLLVGSIFRFIVT